LNYLTNSQQPQQLLQLQSEHNLERLIKLKETPRAKPNSK
jgi:hypothetical protein